MSREGSADTHYDSFLRRNDRLNSDFVCSLPWSGSCTFLFDVSVRTARRVLKRTSSSDFFLVDSTFQTTSKVSDGDGPVLLACRIVGR